MFMGKYQNSIDAKNRMIVPSKYREELGYKCVLTKGIDKCLYIYPMSEWERFMTKLSALPSSDMNARNIPCKMFLTVEMSEAADRQEGLSVIFL